MIFSSFKIRAAHLIPNPPHPPPSLTTQKPLIHILEISKKPTSCSSIVCVRKMEGNMGDYWDKKSLIINELIQGKELAKQLQMHLNIASSSSSSSSLQNQEYLVQKLLNSYEKVLSILNEINDTSPVLRKYEAPEQQQQQPPPPPPVVTGAGVIFGTSLSESPPSRPHSLSESPRSEEYSDQDHEQNKDASKKRKSMPRWTKQVQVCPTGTGIEGTLEDGCSWRKYGQKDILGAKFPRAYYRCTHRNIQGCLATKQVQRSDEDPTIFEITYRGRHTCFQSSNTHPNPSSSSIISTSPPEKKQELELFHQQQQPQQEVLFNFKTGLKVITQGSEDDHVVTLHDNNAFELPSFYFPSMSSSDIKPNHPTFMPSLDDHNNFMMSSGGGGYSPSFVSPATSGSNHFSSASSSTNSLTTIGGMDFPNFGQPEFDPNFTFDNPGFFP